MFKPGAFKPGAFKPGRILEFVMPAQGNAVTSLSSGSGTKMAVTAMPKIRVVPFVSQFVLQSDATTSWSYIDLDIPDVELWGPYVESITAHTDTANRTTNHTWKIVYYYSTDGKKWSAAQDLFPLLNTNGPLVSAPNTTVANFGLHMRYALAVANSTGSVVERAVVTCALSFSFRS